MAQVLILFAHPMLEKSRTQKTLIKGLDAMKQVLFHDLYNIYPDFDIDVQAEQQLLLNYDIIILQHPFYWYSAPPIIKQWIDLVLEHGWAYGKEGKQLKGKKIFNAISTGGPDFTYVEGGFNKYTINQFLAPFEQTAKLCNMDYLPPYVIHSTHRNDEATIKNQAFEYKRLISMLTNNEVNFETLVNNKYINEIIPSQISNF